MQKEKRVCGRLRRANTKRHKEHGASERVAELKSEDRRLKKIRGGYIYIYIYIKFTFCIISSNMKHYVKCKRVRVRAWYVCVHAVQSKPTRHK